MKALVYTGVEELTYRDEKDPTEVSGESILKVHASGICGSDMHAYHGKDERRIPPLILGHEVSGKIQNGKFKDKNVVLNPLITCGKCEYCMNGREHLCPNRVLLGMNRPYERSGVFAEYVSTPNQNIYEIPDRLDLSEATIAEPTAVSLHAVLMGETSLKKPLKECRTLVQGAGAIGLLCSLILSKIKGNKNIIMSDPNKLRLDVCSKYFDGKFVSPNDKEVKENSATTGEKPEIMSQKDAAMFPIIASCALFGLYLFFQFFSKEHINLLLSVYFFVLGIFALSHMISPAVKKMLPTTLIPNENYHLEFVSGSGEGEQR